MNLVVLYIPVNTKTGLRNHSVWRTDQKHSFSVLVVRKMIISLF